MFTTCIYKLPNLFVEFIVFTTSMRSYFGKAQIIASSGVLLFTSTYSTLINLNAFLFRV